MDIESDPIYFDPIYLPFILRARANTDTTRDQNFQSVIHETACVASSLMNPSLMLIVNSNACVNRRLPAKLVGVLLNNKLGWWLMFGT